MEQLIRQNEGFVRTMANRVYMKYAASAGLLSCDVDDMMQEGRIALMKAAETYEAKAGAGFLTYAARVIHNAIVDHIRKERKHADNLVSCEDLPDHPSSNYPDCGHADALNSTMTGDFYRLTPEQIYIRKETIQDLYVGLNKCPARYRAYLLYRFGFEDGSEHSIKETAEHFHLGLSSAKRLEKEGLAFLRACFISPQTC